MAKDVIEMWGRDDGRWQRTPLRGEQPYIPRNLEDLSVLRDELARLGYAPAIINGMSGWLIAKAVGELDTTSKATRAKYRRILNQISRDAGYLADDDPVRSTAA